MSVHQKIIDDLNEIRANHGQTRKRTLTGVTSALIKARLKEGFTLEDFKTVHRKKEKWLESPSMRLYYRPNTLYAPSHFEDYLLEQELTQEERNQITAQQNVKMAEERQVVHPDRKEYEDALVELNSRRKRGDITEEEFYRGRDALQAKYNGEPDEKESWTPEQRKANQERINHILNGCFKSMPSD